MRPTVCLIDDEPAILEALTMLLETQDYEVQSFADAECFLAAPRKQGCIVSDIRMPGLTGIDLVHEMQKRGDLRPIILLTGHGDVALAVHAIKGGAFDFLEKPLKNEKLIETIEAALLKAASIEGTALQLKDLKSRYESLSDRQRDTMHMLIRGLSSKEIAQHLQISPRTVEVHRTWVMTKMGAKTVVELVHMALSLGISGGPTLP